MIEFYKIREAISRYYLENSDLPYEIVVGRDYFKYLARALDNYERPQARAHKGYIIYASTKIRPSEHVLGSDLVLIDREAK